MRQFVIEEGVFSLFPGLEIAALHFTGLDNTAPGAPQLLQHTCQSFAEEIAKVGGAHPYVEDYSAAMRQIRRKKGAKASIEALAKRIAKGEQPGSVNPLVDIYNSIVMQYFFTLGGEDMAALQGDMVLGFARGDEPFRALGADENDNSPPRGGELVYRDDAGCVVRSWLWREADRTKITHQTTEALVYIELINPARRAAFLQAAETLQALVQKELGGTAKLCLLNRAAPRASL